MEVTDIAEYLLDPDKQGISLLLSFALHIKKV